MRLSTKFILLISGSIVIPFLTVFLILALQFSDFPGQLPFLERIRLLRILEKLERRGSELDRIVGLIRGASPFAEALIVDREGRLLFSSFPVDSLREFLSGIGEGYPYTFHRAKVATPDGNTYSVVVGVPIEGRLGLLRHSSMLIVVGSVLGFMTLMSVFIIRSINVSIARLEEATRRISDGDLDFRLQAKGNDRIASLTRSFDKMREQVREETAARSRFIMAVSHDLKTPLASITGYLDAIRDGLATSPQKLERYLSIIRDKTGLLESRISQLIDFVKQETSEWKRSREETPLAPFLAEAATVFSTEAEARGFRFESRVGIAAGLAVSMDGDLVYRALENLVHNAFRYAEPGSTIRFQAEQREERVTLQIRNRGEGIAPADRPFIFEPFYRGAKARRETGFGLGLSVVKSVASSHGWTVDVTSQDGETCFTVLIPLATKTP